MTANSPWPRSLARLAYRLSSRIWGTALEDIRGIRWPVVLAIAPLAAIFASLPGSWWINMHGIRWLWGTPVPFLTVHGPSALHGYYHPVDYLLLTADWLFWTLALLVGGAISKRLAVKARGKIGWPVFFVALVAGLLLLYGWLYTPVLEVFFRGFYFDRNFWGDESASRQDRPSPTRRNKQSSARGGQQTPSANEK